MSGDAMTTPLARATLDEDPAAASRQLTGIPLDTLFDDYVALVRDSTLVGHTNDGTMVHRATRLVARAARELHSDEDVITVLVAYCNARGERDAIVAAGGLYDAGHDFLEKIPRSAQLGLLTRAVYEALRANSQPRHWAPTREAYLTRRLTTLGLSAAEMAIGRVLLTDWGGTEPELVSAIRGVGATLNAEESRLIAAFDGSWYSTVDELLDTVRRLAASE